MLLRPIRFVQALAAIAGVVLLPSCYIFESGESASPPADLKAVAGDGQVTLSWTMDSGVEYWLYWAVGTTVTTTASSSIKPGVASPYTVGGLANGTTYAFGINGRKNGGPGGSLAVVTATPRPVGYQWQIGGVAGTADLKGVTFGAGYDAVGNGGALFQSTDGITWTPAAGNWAALVGANNVNAIINAVGKYIAVGDAGMIVTSTDNVNWSAGTYATPPVTAPKLSALATSGTRVVAVGDGGAIYYSDDAAVTWNAAASVPGGTGNLYGVAYVSTGRWVAVGAAGTIITSTDGSNWVPVTSVTPAIATDLKGVANLPTTTKFSAVGAGGEVATSNDGLVWTTQAITATDLQAVTASVGGTIQFIAVGSAGVAFTSVDGITWTAQTTGTASDLFALAIGSGQLEAVGQAGTTIYSR